MKNQTMTRYQVVEARNTIDLVTSLNTLASEGWRAVSVATAYSPLSSTQTYVVLSERHETVLVERDGDFAEDDNPHDASEMEGWK